MAITIPKLRFQTNLPVRVTFSPKPNDWFGEKNEHPEYGISYGYKVSVASETDRVDYEPGVYVFYATENLQFLIVQAGCTRSDTVLITKKDHPEDAKKKYWTIMKDTLTFSSLGDNLPPTQEEKPPAQATELPPAQTELPPAQDAKRLAAFKQDLIAQASLGDNLPPTQEEKPQKNGQAESGNAFGNSFAEIVARQWFCGKAAKHNAKLLGFAAEESIHSMAASLFIEMSRRGMKLPTREIEAWRKNTEGQTEGETAKPHETFIAAMKNYESVLGVDKYHEVLKLWGFKSRTQVSPTDHESQAAIIVAMEKAVLAQA